MRNNVFTRQDKTRFWFKIGLFFTFLLFSLSNPVSAYYTNMSASVVIGQTDFVSSTVGPTAISPTNPQDVIVVNNKLILADQTDNRVLIWNQVPTKNGTPADIVLGQPNFVSSTANNGGRSASTLNTPTSVASDGTRLFVADRGNHRILIWNQIPVSNMAAADVVVGQTSFSVALNPSPPSCSTLNAPETVFTDGTRMFIVDATNRRVLIFNTIPTANTPTADIVVGQPDCISRVADNGGISAKTLDFPHGVFYNGDKFFVSDESNHRIQIWNSLPTSNFTNADVVIGQVDFSGSSANQGGTVSANTLSTPNNMVVYGNRLFIADQANHRALIYNSIPTSNNASADIVIGQPDFVSNTANNGGIAANRISNATNVYPSGDRLYVSDQSNNRILVFTNIVDKPNLTLSNVPESLNDGLVRFRGEARVSSPYTIKTVEYSLNGGGFVGTQPSGDDHAFDDEIEGFFFDFNPLLNQPRDIFGNLIPGYTIRLRSINNNTDEIDHLFHFTPFTQNFPLENELVDSSYPVFDFSVNRQRIQMRDNLSHYQVQVRKGGENSTEEWVSLIDRIPVDFRSVKGNFENLQAALFSSLDTDDGIYETDTFKATYSDSSSHIKVYSKTKPISGTYQWRVVAIDKSDKSQETEARTIRTTGITGFTPKVTPGFPLTIESITGLGNPNISSYQQQLIKTNYVITTTTPTFFGIAWVNSTVKFIITDQNCNPTISLCTKEYTTTTNPDSRYGFNFPTSSLQRNHKYLIYSSVSLEDKYTELMPFYLTVR